MGRFYLFWVISTRSTLHPTRRARPGGPSLGQGRPGPGLEGRGGRPWSLWPPFTVERSWLPPCTPKAERWGCRKTRCPMGTTAARLVALALDGHPRAAGPGFGTSCRGQPTSPRAHTIDITSCSGHSPASRSLDSRRTPPPGGAVCGAWKWGPPPRRRETDRQTERSNNSPKLTSHPARLPCTHLLPPPPLPPSVQAASIWGHPWAMPRPRCLGVFPRLGPLFPPCS